MNEPITKRDLIEQNVDKVFPEGPSVAEPEMQSMGEVMLRPGGITSAELDAAKALAMAGPVLPEFIRGNPGTMLAVMQIAKRFAKYDARTNSWVTFDPIAVASCMYLVESGGKQSIGYTSQFVGAVIDQFVPWQTRMRFNYAFDLEDRVCIASATLRGDLKPFEYQTPPLRLITPKKSPLWQSDPDRQLAYYARRAWARLYAPGVLLGIYDVEELEGDARQHRGPDHARDVTEGAAALHRRMAEHAAARGDVEHEGFHPEVVDRALGHNHEDVAAVELSAAQGRVLHQDGIGTAPEPEKPPRKRGRPPGSPNKVKKPKQPLRQQAPSQTILPINFPEYRRHLESWLLEYRTEQDIEARWRNESALRNACGIVEDQHTLLQIVKGQRIQQVRK